MKKATPKQLHLAKETLRGLEGDHLRRLQGGLVRISAQTCGSSCGCPTTN